MGRVLALNVSHNGHPLRDGANFGKPASFVTDRMSAFGQVFQGLRSPLWVGWRSKLDELWIRLKFRKINHLRGMHSTNFIEKSTLFLAIKVVNRTIKS